MNVFRLFLITRFTFIGGRFANVAAIQMIVRWLLCARQQARYSGDVNSLMISAFREVIV